MTSHDLIAGYDAYTDARSLGTAAAAPARSTWPTPWTNPITTTTATAPSYPVPTTVAP